MIIYHSNLRSCFASEPEPLFQSLFGSLKTSDKDSKHIDSVKMCPAVKEFCHNTFVIKNPINYNLEWTDGFVKTSTKDQKFFDDNVLIRDSNIGLCTYKFPGDIFLAEKPVIGEITPPFLHDCDINKKAMMIPGSYDMGRHFRSLECAFVFRNKNEKIEFVESQPLYYVRFHTKEKIKFQKFIWNSEMHALSAGWFHTREGLKPLQYWYKMFEGSYRKRILNLIKQNLA